MSPPPQIRKPFLATETVRKPFLKSDLRSPYYLSSDFQLFLTALVAVDS